MRVLLTRATAGAAMAAVSLGCLIGTAGPAAAAGCTTTFDTYATVKVGKTGSKAGAVECLLHQAGYATSQNRSFSTADSRSLEAFPTKHALKATGKVSDAEWAVLQAGGQTPATGGSGGTTPDPAPNPSTKGEVALAFAKDQLGEKYTYAAAGPDTWDCSGLTMKAWAEAGVRLPHSSAAQYKIGAKITKADLQPGDLVFFYDGPSHVGIYAGDGQIIHAPRPGKTVTYIKVSSMPWKGARRPG